MRLSGGCEMNGLHLIEPFQHASRNGLWSNEIPNKGVDQVCVGVSDFLRVFVAQVQLPTVGAFIAAVATRIANLFQVLRKGEFLHAGVKVFPLLELDSAFCTDCRDDALKAYSQKCAGRPRRKVRNALRLAKDFLHVFGHFSARDDARVVGIDHFLVGPKTQLPTANATLRSVASRIKKHVVNRAAFVNNRSVKHLARKATMGAKE